MKHQYFGDETDYRKYGLLRCLAEAGFRIGIVWMLTPDDKRSDGRRIQYLHRPSVWRAYDPAVFDLLVRSVVGEPERNVSRLERAGLLPGARYHSALLGDEAGARRAYFTAAWNAVRGCDLLFIDPDNGIEVPSVPRGGRGSCRYLYWEEAETAWSLGASLLIFQHYRREARVAFTGRRGRELAEHLTDARVSLLSTKHVLFLLALQPAHLERGLAGVQLVTARWRGQVNSVPELPVEAEEAMTLL